MLKRGSGLIGIKALELVSPQGAGQASHQQVPRVQSRNSRAFEPEVTDGRNFLRCECSRCRANPKANGPRRMGADRTCPRWRSRLHLNRHAWPPLVGLGAQTPAPIRLDIVTVTEPHGSPYKGTHARYILRSFICTVKC
jgi:hypothetical protein